MCECPAALVPRQTSWEQRFSHILQRFLANITKSHGLPILRYLSRIPKKRITRRGIKLRLERPILARTGDRFVIRSYSPVTTIGGGVVAEALASKRKKLRAQEATELQTIIDGDAESVLGAVLRLASWRGISVAEVPIRTGLAPDACRSAKGALIEGGAREAGGQLFDVAIVEAARALMEEAVDVFHRDQPLRAGITVELLRQTVPTHDDGRLADALLSEAVTSGSLEVRDSAVSRPGYEPVVTEGQHKVMDELAHLYRDAGLAAPLVSELPDTFSGRDDLWPLLKLLERRGRLVALENELFIDAEGFSAATERVARELAGATGLGPADNGCGRSRSGPPLPRSC